MIVYEVSQNEEPQAMPTRFIELYYSVSQDILWIIQG